MKVLAIIKFFLIIGMLVYFILCGLLVLPFLFIFPKFPSMVIKFNQRVIARAILFLTRTKVVIKGDLKRKGTFLVVSNHQSYFDIAVHTAFLNISFVTSYEIKETPFLGHIATAAGCLFVERRDRSNLPNEIKNIGTALQKGHNVIFYPEATSTNGEEILRFRKPLFQAALDTKTPLQILTTNYKTISKETFSLQNRDKICWYGDMTFAPHLFNLLQQSEIMIEINVDYLDSENYSDTTQLAAAAQKIVTSKFNPAR